MMAFGTWAHVDILFSGPDARKLGARRKKRMAGLGSWLVLYPGLPKVGDGIRVLRMKDGAFVTRYVRQVVTPCTMRLDGRSVLRVSARQVHRAHEGVERQSHEAPNPVRRPPERQRNPRVCEQCEGPCRPGAGVCDVCKTP